MKQFICPDPPSPDDARYPNVMAWQRAMFDWAKDLKGKMDAMSRVNFAPAGQALALGSYTLTTALSGTATGTQVTNFVLTLAAALQAKGITKPV